MVKNYDVIRNITEAHAKTKWRKIYEGTETWASSRCPSVSGKSLFFSLVNSHFQFFSSGKTSDFVGIVSDFSESLNDDQLKPSGLLESVISSSQELFSCISSQVSIQWPHSGSWKPAIVGVFVTQKSANATNQDDHSLWSLASC